LSGGEKIHLRLIDFPCLFFRLISSGRTIPVSPLDEVVCVVHAVEDFNNQSEKEIDRLIKLGIIRLADKDRWKVVSKVSDDQIMVSDGVRGGIIPSSYPPHFSWLCPTCLSFGPWNGNRCESCGHFSTPD